MEQQPTVSDRRKNLLEECNLQLGKIRLMEEEMIMIATHIHVKNLAGKPTEEDEKRLKLLEVGMRTETHKNLDWQAKHL